MLPTPSPTPDGIVTDYNYTNGIVTSSVVDAGGSSQEATA
jgi:YD repeat-containing protein